MNGSLPAASDVNWYSFPVTAGTTYRVWWNDRDQGDGTFTSSNGGADVYVSGYYFTGGSASDLFNEDQGWNNARPGTGTGYTPNANGTIYLRVIPYNSGATFTGNYAIVFSTGSTRPVAGDGGGWTVPAGLIATWTSQYGEQYTITGTTFSSEIEGYPGYGYAGTIVNVRQDSSTEGYITIQYTYNANYTGSPGRYYVIRYRNLTGPTVQLSAAYLASDPDFNATTGTGGKATQAEAESAYTVGNGYFASYSTLSKQ